ncbi:hypothetical protein QN277_010635 [Acacia crassicarpa]|uniref:Uncharacterized protein n=1 Tax=Acacia crassicarpa TaxID=499986 RepID=A0AAE1M4W3_9FABA|nr:hypothetical protein QN277_010635 [Acacia crassicarpa]
MHALESIGNMYKNEKRKIEKGVAFPTCISEKGIL